jgi:hypothetical protein
MIDYRILGPLEVSADGRPVEIGGPKLRAGRHVTGSSLRIGGNNAV